MDKRIVIADDNTQFTEELKKYFDAQDGYRVVGVAADGLEAVNLVEKQKPDYLLLDIVMPELDGFGVLNAMAAMNVAKPVTVMVSQLASDGFVTKSLRLGASYFMAKPLSFDKLKEYLDECSHPHVVRPQPEMRRREVRAVKTLDEKIANIFISVGIPAHIKGYQFLREAIKMAVDTPEIINSITKKLYPSIADKFETSSSKVERAIRHAIEVAWNRGKIENINSIFGIKVYSANEKPTNGEFIALVADKMLLEGA
jgi:Response regulator containing CheY-like receiver domain and AraC-type DNA-binding domain